MFVLATRPLILSPAGSYDALCAAINSGADEVYFGLSSHNARQNAKNFTPEETEKAIRECKLRGVKTNITLNTLVTDREIPDACRLAYNALCMGADAFIVQDIGLASALKKSIPEITLHASTQCACHSAEGAKQLAELGFERIVLAREMNSTEIEKVVKLGVETEIFVHGALCVCHSGMCLMSSVIGKRSGNRGLCAQPCRLPYNFGETKAEGRNACNYPLSLKDLSLAKHIPELTELGVTSLKIEGRMKPPEYVSGVTGIWKKLVTENRNATDEEYEYLEKLFSRSGFTDGYFTDKYRIDNRKMYGVRTDSDKQDTKLLETAKAENPSKRAVTMTCIVTEGENPVLTIKCEDAECMVKADFTAQTASSRPMTEEDIANSLVKLGDTVFECTGIQVSVTGQVFVAKSQLNALRRTAVTCLEEKILRAIPHPDFDDSVFALEKAEKRAVQPKLRLLPESEVSLDMMLRKYASYDIESVCIPLGMFRNDDGKHIAQKVSDKGIFLGVRLPRVVFAEESGYTVKMLNSAKENGAVYAVAENIGHIPLIKRAGLKLYAGAAMNVFNSFCIDALKNMGFESVTLSPELLTAQMRDMKKNGISPAVIGSGRLELMVLESCVERANGNCNCTDNRGVCTTICDRTGAVFPVKCEHRMSEKPYPGRNIIMNSVPVHLIDKPAELEKSGAEIICIMED